jgi:hypothetical protein
MPQYMAKAMDKHILPQHRITQRFGPWRIQVLFAGGKGEQGLTQQGWARSALFRTKPGLIRRWYVPYARGVFVGTKIMLAHAF